MFLKIVYKLGVVHCESLCIQVYSESSEPILAYDQTRYKQKENFMPLSERIS